MASATIEVTAQELIPFDLERALTGDPVFTAIGQPVTELTLFSSASYCQRLVGVSGGVIQKWNDDGTYKLQPSEDGDSTSLLDLRMGPKITTLYLNIYRDGDDEYVVDAYASAKKADFGGNIEKRLGLCAHTLTIREK